MVITNKLNLPEAMVKAVGTSQHNSTNSLSATTLLKGVKEIVLTKRHWEELSDDVSDRIWAIFGTAVHSLLEHEGRNEVTEEQLSADVNGINITGRLDNYNLKTGVITDYKTASVWKVKFNDFTDWKQQGLVYAWLLRSAGFTVTKCRFLAMLKDHSKTEARRSAEYPQSPVYVYEFNVTAEMIEQTKLFIEEKVRRYKEAEYLQDDDILECTAEERWAKADQWAVKKTGVKRAVKLYGREEDANEHANREGLQVEFRRGVSTKCLDYCSCNKFCNFYKSMKENK